MPIRIVLSKESASGEHISVEVTQSHPVTGDTVHSEAEMKDIMERAITIVDERMVEMNMRMLESRGLEQFFNQQTWSRFRQVLEVIYGRMSVDTLTHRWQSEKEETGELELARAQAYADGLSSICNNNIIGQSYGESAEEETTPKTGFIGSIYA